MASEQNQNKSNGKNNLDSKSSIVIHNDRDELHKIYPIEDFKKNSNEFNIKILDEENGTNNKLINIEDLKVDNSFNIIFNKNSINSLYKINFLAKNYRPKCDICKKLCNLDWFMQKEKTNETNKTSFLICDTCFDLGKYSESEYNLQKKDFESANFFNIINKSESKFLNK